MTTMHNVTVLKRDGKYYPFQVPEEVYIYIRQLEAYIKHPDLSKLKELYSDRFKECKNDSQ